MTMDELLALIVRQERRAFRLAPPHPGMREAFVEAKFFWFRFFGLLMPDVEAMRACTRPSARPFPTAAQA